MEANPKRVLKKLSRSQIFHVYEILKEVGEKKPGNIYEYKPGWSDELVAQKVGGGATHWGVKHIRMETFGKLVVVTKSTKDAKIENRLNDLENLYLALLKRVENIESDGF